jgi:glutaredoxin
MDVTTERTVIVYTREDCHLCKDTITTIRSVAESVEPPIKIALVDVDQNETLRTEYGDRVPYVVIDGRPAFKYRVDEHKLRQKLE